MTTAGTGNVSPEVQYLDVTGLRMAFRAHGSGEPTVLIHGLGGMSTNWTDLMVALGDRLQCVAIDLPGFGHSEPFPGIDLTLEACAEVVAHFIEQHFGAVPVHVFGNSLGGVVAVRLAAERPDLVRTLTLISPALPEYRPRRTNVQIPLAALPMVGERLFKRWLAWTPEQRAWGTVTIVYADPKRINPVRWQEMREETIRRDDVPHSATVYLAALRGLVRSFFNIGKRNPWNWLRQVRAPLLVIHGRRDVLVDPANARYVNAYRPGATVAVMADTAHVSQMERPTLVAEPWRETFSSGKP